MAIKFNVHEIGNPSDPEADKKFYARPVHAGEISLQDLAADISYASTLTESDVHAVLQALVREIPRNISRGYIVRLGNLGSFLLGSRSDGSDTAEEVSAANIKNTRLMFRAGRQVRVVMDNLTFKKSSG